MFFISFKMTLVGILSFTKKLWLEYMRVSRSNNNKKHFNKLFVLLQYQKYKFNIVGKL